MKVKEFMTPVAEYTTVKNDATLAEVFQELARAGHRDVLVLDKDGAFQGTVTMHDVLLSLEPNYKKLVSKDLSSDTLTNKLVADLFREYGLWSDPLKDLCAKKGQTKITDVMYVPEESEYLEADDDLEKGVHEFVVGVHQPLIVRDKGKVVGVLRMSDIFEVIKNLMLTCHA